MRQVGRAQEQVGRACALQALLWLCHWYRYFTEACDAVVGYNSAWTLVNVDNECRTSLPCNYRPPCCKTCTSASVISNACFDCVLEHPCTQRNHACITAVDSAPTHAAVTGHMTWNMLCVVMVGLGGKDQPVFGSLALTLWILWSRHAPFM